MSPKVQFEIADVTKRDYELESFDVIYSRDTILHIADKRALFTKFLVKKQILSDLLEQYKSELSMKLIVTDIVEIISFITVMKLVCKTLMENFSLKNILVFFENVYIKYNLLSEDN